MKENNSDFTVLKMCNNLDASVSGYYEWIDRDTSQREIKNELLKSLIRYFYFEVHNKMAGSHLITQDIRDVEEFNNIHRTRVAALMHTMGLRSHTQKKFIATTDSKHNNWVADNLLNREFNPEEPNQKIAGDITYIEVGSKWAYLSVFLDLFSRKVVGWDLSESLEAESTCMALKKYFFKCNPCNGVMIHSDRGVQYTSEEFRKILKNNKAIQSMSRKGNCWDNAVSESFFHSLKSRLTHHRRYETLEDLNRDLYWYIEIYYNRVRKHSANNWLTPEEMENSFHRSEHTA